MFVVARTWGGGMDGYRTVVVGTDGSDSSLRAVERAGEAAGLVVFAARHGLDGNSVNLYFKVSTLNSGTVPASVSPSLRPLGLS